MKAWIAAAAAAVALISSLILTAGVSQAHDQPVQNDCLSHTVTAGANQHGAVTPTFTTVTDTSVTVNWTDTCNNEDAFRVFRDGANVSGNLAANSVSYVDAGLTCGTEYTYYVQAFNNAQGTDDSLSANVTTDACGPPPPASCPTGNHGQYVSCVARGLESPPGKGQNGVKDAARSDEGKPNP
jgi:hypothetical protein